MIVAALSLLVASGQRGWRLQCFQQQSDSEAFVSADTEGRLPCRGPQADRSVFLLVQVSRVSCLLPNPRGGFTRLCTKMLLSKQTARQDDGEGVLRELSEGGDKASLINVVTLCLTDSESQSLYMMDLMENWTPPPPLPPPLTIQQMFFQTGFYLVSLKGNKVSETARPIWKEDFRSQIFFMDHFVPHCVSPWGGQQWQ